MSKPRRKSRSQLVIAAALSWLAAGCGYRLRAREIGDDAGRESDASNPLPEAGSDSSVPLWSYDDADAGSARDLFCSGLPAWDAGDGWNEILLNHAVNAARSSDRTCPEGGWRPATGSLRMRPSLRCAARQVALDIDTTGHTDVAPGEFVDPATSDLLLAWGYRVDVSSREFAQADSADAAVDGWLADPFDCESLLVGGTRDFGGGVIGDVWVAIAATSW
jgi:hypothetical protein